LRPYRRKRAGRPSRSKTPTTPPLPLAIIRSTHTLLQASALSPLPLHRPSTFLLPSFAHSLPQPSSCSSLPFVAGNEEATSLLASVPTQHQTPTITAACASSPSSVQQPQHRTGSCPRTSLLLGTLCSNSGPPALLFHPSPLPTARRPWGSPTSDRFCLLRLRHHWSQLGNQLIP
jgi:hypothetical protein